MLKDLNSMEAGRWMAASPQPVQDAVESVETELTIQGIVKQFSLNENTANLLAKMVYYMLIDYVSPDDVARELDAIGIPSEQVKLILNVVKQKIFVPVWNKLPRETNPNASQLKPTMRVSDVSGRHIPNSVPAVQRSTSIPDISKGMYAPPLQSPRYPGQQVEVQVNKVAQQPARQAPLAPGVIGQGQKFVPKHPFVSQAAAKAPAPIVPATGGSLRDAVQSAIRKDEKLLSDHEEPHIDLRTTQAPANLPGVVQPAAHAPMPERAAPQLPIQRVTYPTPPTPPGLPPLTKSYSVDPYREPLDEEGK